MDAFSTKCVLRQDKKDKVDVVIKTRTGNMPIDCGALSRKDSGVVRLVNNRKTIIEEDSKPLSFIIS